METDSDKFKIKKLRQDITYLELKLKENVILIHELNSVLKWIETEFEFIDSCGCAKNNSTIEATCKFHAALLYSNRFLEGHLNKSLKDYK